MLLRARWPEIYADGGALLDPMCGSGTLADRGRADGGERRAGLRSEYFGFLGWRRHDIALWQRLLDEAETRAQERLARAARVFFGSDLPTAHDEDAKRNAQEAGVAGFVQLQQRDIAHPEQPAGFDTGLLITNPPYGERMGERDEMP